MQRFEIKFRKKQEKSRKKLDRTKMLPEDLHLVIRGTKSDVGKIKELAGLKNRAKGAPSSGKAAGAKPVFQKVQRNSIFSPLNVSRRITEEFVMVRIKQTFRKHAGEFD